jgi:3-deoxy-manno-octulosonate cytidylyltransferase (CMP-KDO synthetase)
MPHKVLGIIPARFASTRFPGKPLVNILGKPMIQLVYEAAKKCKTLSEVVVATDNEHIFNVVESFGGKAVLTSDQHKSGTDRCAEVVKILTSQFDYVVNIQGDEPSVESSQIEALIQGFNDPETQICTLAKQIDNPSDLLNPNVVKVIFSPTANALYFSRSPIPFARGINQEDWVNQHDYYKHIGLYAYKTSVLLKIATYEEGILEKIESLEQLRWLEKGIAISVLKTNIENIGIDTPEDLDNYINQLNNS